jgi:hypothetical protein
MTNPSGWPDEARKAGETLAAAIRAAMDPPA